MSGLFTLSEVDSGTESKDTRTRAPKVAEKITRGYQTSLEWDEMSARYVMSWSKFKLEEQLYFAAKRNITHMRRLQGALNAKVKYIKDNNLNLRIILIIIG